MDQEELIKTPGTEPDAPEMDAVTFLKADKVAGPFNKAQALAKKAAQAQIERMRKRVDKFNADPVFVAELAAVKRELTEFLGVDWSHPPFVVRYALDKAVEIIRGVECRVLSIQAIDPESGQVEALDERNHPRLPYVDAAVDHIIDFSRDYAIPKYLKDSPRPTDRLIGRAIDSACKFFDSNPDNLDKAFVERAKEEQHLRSLGRHKHGTKTFKVPVRLPEPEPEPVAIQDAVIVATVEDQHGSQYTKLLQDVNDLLGKQQRKMSDAEIIAALQQGSTDGLLPHL